MEHHAVSDLLTVGARGVVSCRCGWSAQVVGPRSALLDVWAEHVRASEADERETQLADQQPPDER